MLASFGITYQGPNLKKYHNFKTLLGALGLAFP